MHFVANGKLSDPGRGLGETPTETGPSFTATARGDLGLQPRGKAVTLANKPHLQGSSRMTQHPGSAAPAPTVPMSGVHANPCCMGLLLGQRRKEKHALQTAVWGVSTGVITGTVCRLPAILSLIEPSRQHPPPAPSTSWSLGSSSNLSLFPQGLSLNPHLGPVLPSPSPLHTDFLECMR